MAIPTFFVIGENGSCISLHHLLLILALKKPKWYMKERYVIVSYVSLLRNFSHQFLNMQGFLVGFPNESINDFRD